MKHPKVAAAALIATVAIGLNIPDLPWEPTKEDRQRVTELGQQPEEDEPGWDCATMGNKICGPTAP